MARQSTEGTYVQTKFAPELHARLMAAADERVVSPGLIVQRAVQTYLDGLAPVADVLPGGPKPDLVGEAGPETTTLGNA